MGRWLQKVIGGVVEHVAHGIVGAAHDALHAVDRAQIVAAIDALAAARADQNVLVVVGHADHFMGHDLADGKNQIEAALRDQPVDLRRPGIIQLAFRLLANELGGNLAQGLDVGAPVMNAEEILRHIAEHVRDLVRAHGGVRAQRGQNGLEPVAVVLPRIARQLAGAGVLAASDRAARQARCLRCAELGQALRKQIVQLPRSQIGIGASYCAVKTHATDSTFFSPGASRTMMSSETR